jgi:hypothetical protein
MRTGEVTMKKWVIYILLCCFSSVSFGQDDVPAIIDKLTDLFDNYNRCHLKSEKISQVKTSKTAITNHATFELFYDQDGSRCNGRGYMWGEMNSSGKVVSKEQAEYVRTMYDGQALKHYTESPERNVYTMDPTISKERSLLSVKRALSRGWPGSEAIGYFGDDQRIDVCLKNAEKIRLYNEKISVNGSECYVLDAVSGNVNYKLWIDPEHGYNIAKAVVNKEPGSYMGTKRLESGESIQFRVDTVSYKKVNDVWVVSEANIVKKSDTREFKFLDKIQYKLLEADFDPDFEKLNAFGEKDVKNGTKVYVVGVDGINYTWQDGELVPDVDEAAIDQLDKMTEEILAEKKKALPEDASVTLDAILAEYRKTQKRLELFYCEGTVSENDKQTTEDLYTCDGASFGVQVRAGVKVNDYFIWDGKKTIHYTNESVQASVNKEKPYQLLATVYPGASLLGYLNKHPERIDVLLSKVVKEATVSEEKLNEKDCYLVKAAIGKDTYHVWFSPEQGYHIIKAEIQTDAKTVYLLDQVQFKTIENVPVPVSCAVKDSSRQYTYERTKIELKPNFTALKGFESAISDGTGVTVEGMTGKYYWNGGKVVDGEGKDVF